MLITPYILACTLLPVICILYHIHNRDNKHNGDNRPYLIAFMASISIYLIYILAKYMSLLLYNYDTIDYVTSIKVLLLIYLISKIDYVSLDSLEKYFSQIIIVSLVSSCYILCSIYTYSFLYCIAPIIAFVYLYTEINKKAKDNMASFTLAFIIMTVQYIIIYATLNIYSLVTYYIRNHLIYIPNIYFAISTLLLCMKL